MSFSLRPSLLRRTRVASLVVFFVGIAGHASAVTLVYSGAFTPEGGPTASGSGSATVTIDTVSITMRVQADFSGLSGTTAAAHVHCCTASPGVGNVGVATELPTFTGFPLGVTSGSYDFTYDMTQAANFNPSFITANGGSTSAALAALIAGLGDDRHMRRRARRRGDREVTGARAALRYPNNTECHSDHPPLDHWPKLRSAISPTKRGGAA